MLSARNSPAADETKFAGEWSDDNTSIAKPVNVDGDEDDFGSYEERLSLRANRAGGPCSLP